jgi:crossover junction endodeoxyribonuclease RuvC
VSAFLGIDPGLSGAIASYDPATGDLVVHDIPTHTLKRNGKTKREIDLHATARIMDDLASSAGASITVEQVGAMPSQGVSSVFAFGKAYGALLALAASTFVPLHTVTPQVWKKALQVPSAKDGARARASALLPRHAGLWPRAKDDGRAEAALIALYASRQGEAA